MSKCDIIIPVWNQLKATKRCLDSLLQNTRFDFNLIIVDNGSEKKTKDFLKDFERNNPKCGIILIRNEKNKGFVKAVNQGMRESRADYICILNNDTIVTEGWLSEMIKIFQINPGIGIVNPSSNNLGQKPARGQKIEDYVSALKPESGKYVELMNALGFCMLIKRALIEEIGLFDEIYGMGNFEDTDFSMRAKRKGYLCVRALGAYVYHKENTSFNVFGGYHYEFEKNKKIFESRWGKQKRILFIIGKNILEESHKQKISKELDQNNWVYLAGKSDLKFSKDHPGVNMYHFGNMFNVKVLLKILFKKKKFDEIYCDSLKLLQFLRLLQSVHKAALSVI